MKRLSVLLADKQDKRLRDLAKKTGHKIGELVRRAIDRFLSEPDV